MADLIVDSVEWRSEGHAAVVRWATLGTVFSFSFPAAGPALFIATPTSSCSLRFRPQHVSLLKDSIVLVRASTEPEIEAGDVEKARAALEALSEGLALKAGTTLGIRISALQAGEHLRAALGEELVRELEARGAGFQGTFGNLVRGNSATIPVGIQDVQGDGRWPSIYGRHVATARKGFESIFVGDSLIQQMELSSLWKQLEVYKPLNFGIGGDEVQHALWRLQNGGLAEHSPKFAVILVGTNNHRHTATEVAEGITALVQWIQKTWPTTKIVLVALLPRGEKPNPLRHKVAQVNALLKQIAGIHLVDVGARFVEEDGSIRTSKMHDYLHLTNEGYAILWEAIGGVVSSF